MTDGIRVERVYNGNEYTHDSPVCNRTYTGVIGWRWMLYIDEIPAGDWIGYKTKREAIEEANRILNRRGVKR